jgi:hypothetical protein
MISSFVPVQPEGKKKLNFKGMSALGPASNSGPARTPLPSSSAFCKNIVQRSRTRCADPLERERLIFLPVSHGITNVNEG